MTKELRRQRQKVTRWSVLTIFLGEGEEADFASDCNTRKIRRNCGGISIAVRQLYYHACHRYHLTMIA